MKRLMTATTAIAALTAGAAFAATDINDLDMTGNGFASMEEVMMAYPTLPATEFEQIDANDDNRLSPEEVLATEAQDIFARYDMVPMDDRGPYIVLDNDGDGFIQYSDMLRAYPGFTAVDFESIDLNDDNRLEYAEYYETEAQDTIARYTATDTVRDIAEIDTNNDDFADADEMMAAFPGLTAESFEEIDLNDDNRISFDELYAPEAQEIVSRSGS